MKDKTKMIASVRDQLKIALQVGLQEALGTPLHMHILFSNVQHDELQPTGDAFDIHFRVQVHPKPKEEKEGEVKAAP